MIGGDGTGRSGTRSLDVIEEVVRRERETQLRHGDALDSKAGVMLGFAGALVALSAFWPRGYGAAKLRAFRERYLAAEPTFARLHLADAQTAVAEELAVTLGHKAARVKWSMTLLATAAMLVATGLLVD